MPQIIANIKAKLFNIFKPITTKIPLLNKSNSSATAAIKEKALIYLLAVTHNSILNKLENECKATFEEKKIKSLRLPDNSPEQQHALENVHIMSQNLKIIANEKQLIVDGEQEFKEYIKSTLFLRNIAPFKKTRSK